MHEETLAKPTRKLFDTLGSKAWLSNFYLAGGTALALRLGHRISVDLDFFSTVEFNEKQVIEQLREIGPLEIFQTARQSVTGALEGVKFSFLGYKYPMLNKGEPWHNITIASVEDVACMKLDALSSRGTKRDFIDVYFIAKQIPLRRMLDLFVQKYSTIRFNLLHVKKSLVYFNDAEDDPMPGMIQPADWDEVKKFFVTEVKDL